MIKKTDAGWSSLVARRAHNPKVTGSNPVPATNDYKGLAALAINPFVLDVSFLCHFLFEKINDIAFISYSWRFI
jgi:hypothetical protein